MASCYIFGIRSYENGRAAPMTRRPCAVSVAAQEAAARGEGERACQRTADLEHARTHRDLGHCDAPLSCYQKRGLRFRLAAAVKKSWRSCLRPHTW